MKATPTSDIHSELALNLFGKVTADTRTKAKLINYSRMYGAENVIFGGVLTPVQSLLPIKLEKIYD